MSDFWGWAFCSACSMRLRRSYRRGRQHRRAANRPRRYRQARTDLGARPHTDSVRIRRRRDRAGSRDPADSLPALETAVGIMLVGLGANVLWRLWRDRVHFGQHGHDEGTRHVHIHGHLDESTQYETLHLSPSSYQRRQKAAGFLAPFREQRTPMVHFPLKARIMPPAKSHRLASSTPFIACRGS